MPFEPLTIKSSKLKVFILFPFLWLPLIVFMFRHWIFATLGFHSFLGNDSDLEIIQKFWPNRLIEPQWLGNNHHEMELLMQWTTVEALARLTLCYLVACLLTFLTFKLFNRIARNPQLA